MQIYPASVFAQNFGVKSIVYGGPGLGKTPIINTAPRPILCLSEPGALSLRNSNVPSCGAFNAKDIDDFYRWLGSSREVNNYDTIGVDSISQQAEIILADELPKHKDPRKAYGELSRKFMGYMNQLFFTQYKHTYLICKQTVVEENHVNRQKPYFPGQDLNVKIPHLFDLILHLGIFNVPGVGQTKAFHTVDTLTALARDRSGKLSEYEPTDLNQIFAKIMKG